MTNEPIITPEEIREIGSNLGLGIVNCFGKVALGGGGLLYAATQGNDALSLTQFFVGVASLGVIAGGGAGLASFIEEKRAFNRNPESYVRNKKRHYPDKNFG